MKKKLIALGMAAVLTLGSLISASGDIQDEIDDLTNETEYTEYLIDSINETLDELEAQKKELMGQIDETDAQLILTIATITTLEQQIDLKNAELEETTENLELAIEQENTEYNAMKKRIQYLYETGGEGGWATVLLSGLSISDILNQAEYTQKMYEYDRNCLEEYAETVQEVTSLKEQQELEKYQLELMKTNEEEQKEYFEEMLAALQAENADYEDRISYADGLAAQYVALLNEQNAMIESLLEEQQRQAAEAARAAAEAAAQAAAEAAARAETEAAQAAAEAAARAAEQAAAAAAEAAAAQDSAAAAEAAAAAQAAAEAAAAEQAAAEAAAAEQAAAEQAAAEQAAAEQAAAEQAAAEQAAASSSVESWIDLSNPIVARAYAWVGRAEYVWGACSPGAFDCSGFVSYCVTGVYARIGDTARFMTFPRVSDPQPGDICVRSGHCGIYIGNGLMIHCSDYGVGVIIGAVQSGMIYVRY